ncbi:hypothetical protein ANTPLA_LOCUS3737 [Anthophora plagiata]
MKPGQDNGNDNNDDFVARCRIYECMKGRRGIAQLFSLGGIVDVYSAFFMRTVDQNDTLHSGIPRLSKYRRNKEGGMFVQELIFILDVYLARNSCTFFNECSAIYF